MYSKNSTNQRIKSLPSEKLFTESIQQKIQAGKSIEEIFREYGVDEAKLQDWENSNLFSKELTNSSSIISPARFKELEQKVIDLNHLLLSQTQVIGIPSLQGTHFIPMREIIYCKGESSQSSIHAIDKKRYLVNRTLKECELVLEPYGFCRIHKSYMINKIHINRFYKGAPKRVLMTDGVQLEVSNAYKEQLSNLLIEI